MSSGIKIQLPKLPIIGIAPRAAPVVKLEFTQGMSGPRGTWEVDKSFRLKQLPLTIDRGRIEINFSEANTYYLLMTEDVTQVTYTSLPEPGVSVRVQLYLEQDSIGSRFITGWPPGTQTPSGIIPILTPTPGAMDSLVIDTFDGGATSQLNIVGQGYVPLAVAST